MTDFDDSPAAPRRPSAAPRSGITFARVSREEMDAKHAAASPRRVTSHVVKTPKNLNTQQVLDLGNLIFFTFRGRPYGIPMLTYKDGLVLEDLKAQVHAFVGNVKTRDDLAAYAALVRRIPRKLWSLTIVAGVKRRWWRRFGLLANPFERCTEAELGELLDLFSRRRMTSGVQYPSTVVRQPTLTT